jgi:hypothetical protein
MRNAARNEEIGVPERGVSMGVKIQILFYNIVRSEVWRARWCGGSGRPSRPWVVMRRACVQAFARARGTPRDGRSAVGRRNENKAMTWREPPDGDSPT